MPSFKCKDIGMTCGFEVSAKNEAELMTKIADHAAKVHNMKQIPADVSKKIKAAIKK